MEMKKWGWINPDGDTQEKMFNSPDEAIKDMQSRSGSEIERTYELGFKLVYLQVTATPIMVLERVPEWQ